MLEKRAEWEAELVDRAGLVETVEQMRDRLMPDVLSYAEAEGLTEAGIASAALRMGITAARAHAAALAEQGETEWVDVVLGRKVSGEGDWYVTQWHPNELDKAREMFPESEYTPGKADWLPVTNAESEEKA